MAKMTNMSGGLKPINLLKTASDLDAKLDALKSGRGNLEAQWKLNMAFYKGRQYTYFNRSLRRLESLPVEDGEKPRYRVRLINNQIAPGVHALLAKLTKTKPVVYATPTSGSESDLKAAQLSDKLLEHWWVDLNLDDKLAEALMWAIITGQGYWKITWDEHAGKSMRFLVDPESGQPIVDDALEDLFRAELTQMGMDESQVETTIYLGDLKVESISPFDVFLDDSAKVFDECKYAICVHYMTPEEIKERWKITVQADATSGTPEAPGVSGGLKSTEPTVKEVKIGYFVPHASLPKGRYVIWIDQEIVEDQPWPYPFNELPLIKFPGMRVPGTIYDRGDVEDAIPMQKDLNKTLSQIIEYKNLTLKPRVWAPTGSLSGVRLTSEPGVVYEYNPIGDRIPETEKLPTLPPYVFEHLNTLRQSIREAFGIVDVTEGVPPPNVEAGIAIDLLQEMATDRLAPRITLLERALARAGDQMLKYAQKYYIEPRILKIGGSGSASSTKRFKQADLQGHVNVAVEAGSALPRTRAGRQARILEYVDRGVISPTQAYKYLDIADLEGLGAKFKSDEDHAHREHDKLLEGQPINPMAAQAAVQAVQSGQALDDQGQPIQDMQQAQAYVQSESLRPFPFENYQAHVEVHASFMKSPEFESLPPEIQQNFITHYHLTTQAILSQPQPIEFQAVRPTLQIKATAGPTPVSKILEKAGVEVTPEDLTEPPLETWVTDSVDKPDMDEAGNDPLTQLDVAMKKMDIQAKMTDAALRSGKADLSGMHESQMHEHKVREQAAKAALAEKKLQQMDFTPKKKE